MTAKTKASAKQAEVDERTADAPTYVDIKITKVIEVEGHKYRPGARIRVLSTDVPKFADAL